jgi:hypothetical protein
MAVTKNGVGNQVTAMVLVTSTCFAVRTVVAPEYRSIRGDDCSVAGCGPRHYVVHKTMSWLDQAELGFMLRACWYQPAGAVGVD